jgi:hypothetical protein
VNRGGVLQTVRCEVILVSIAKLRLRQNVALALPGRYDRLGRDEMDVHPKRGST